MKSRAHIYIAFLETLEIPTSGHVSSKYYDNTLLELGLPMGAYPDGTYGYMRADLSCILVIPDIAAMERLLREHGALSEEDWTLVNTILLLEAVL